LIFSSSGLPEFSQAATVRCQSHSPPRQQIQLPPEGYVDIFASRPLISEVNFGSGWKIFYDRIAGLRRGFIQSGAKNLLMTLWLI